MLTLTPSIPALRLANASLITTLSRRNPNTLPVAVFVGGTSGVGQGTASAFASHINGNANIILVGRNELAAKSIISTFPQSSTGAKHEFMRCDVTLMREVQNTTSEILASYPKINYLVMSPGFITTKGRETSEGIDKKLAIHYYARWKFIADLIPGLLRAREEGEDARVLSVLTAGKGTDVQRYLESGDWGMKKSFSQVAIARAGPTYMDLMMEVRLQLSSELSYKTNNPF